MLAGTESSRAICRRLFPCAFAARTASRSIGRRGLPTAFLFRIGSCYLVGESVKILGFLKGESLGALEPFDVDSKPLDVFLVWRLLAWCLQNGTLLSVPRWRLMRQIS